MARCWWKAGTDFGRNEIDADQSTLEDLIEKLGKKESAARKAGAWIAEKFSRAKIRLSDSEEGQMGLLHAPRGPRSRNHR